MTPIRMPSIGLAACVLGFATTPFIYVAIGALSQFPVKVSVLSVPPLLFGCGFLLWRFLSKPQQRKTPAWLWMAEGGSWLAILVFLRIVSGFTLLTPFERIGLTCIFFLGASAICLPVPLLRKTALEERLSRIPNPVAIGALVVALAVSSVIAYLYVATPARFI